MTQRAAIHAHLRWLALLLALFVALPVTAYDLFQCLQRARLIIKSGQIDSSTLTIRIDTPDKQHAEVEFDLQDLR